jgi:RluA family pseudouridine synthase
MSLQKWTLKTTVEHRGLRLDDVLVGWLPRVLKQPVSKGKVRKLVIAGAVYLNGRRVRIASKLIQENVSIQVYLDLKKLNSDQKSQDRAFEMTQDHVRFEDDHLIVVDKPSGIPTQATLDESRDHLFAAVKRFLAQRDGLPLPQVYLGLHHRLDRDTSGLILMTKSKEANPGVAELFTSHAIVKVYQALVASRRVAPQAEWTVKNYLGRPPGSGKKVKWRSVHSGGDFAHTDFRLLEDLGSAYWVEARPKTGRTHQIRVHLSEDQMSILGDPTYSNESAAGGHLIQVPRLMLHAVSLTFIHPIYQTKISLQSDLPEDLKKCLQVLRKKGRDC